MAFDSEVGFRVDLTFGTECTAAEACFGESTSRVVLSVSPDRVAGVLGRAVAAAVPAQVVGEAKGDRLVAVGAFDVLRADAERAWRDALPRLLSAI
jgi:phosphoribosylformylglycinamidine (FGAM) synthase-like enzyme